MLNLRTLSLPLPSAIVIKIWRSSPKRSSRLLHYHHAAQDNNLPDPRPAAHPTCTQPWQVLPGQGLPVRRPQLLALPRGIHLLAPTQGRVLIWWLHQVQLIWKLQLIWRLINHIWRHLLITPLPLPTSGTQFNSKDVGVKNRLSFGLRFFTEAPT